MHPQLIKIGDFFVPSYGTMVALGFLAALWMTSRLARRSGLNTELVVNLGVYCALAGLLGAKLLMVLYEWEYYLRNPGELFSLTTLQAGGAFQGGLMLALIVAVVYMRRHKMPGLVTADTFASGVALGHSIGRVGCFLAGCCWGSECRLPWAVTFTNPMANQYFGTPLNVPLHPAQLYEVGAVLIIFGILYWRFHRPHTPGTLIGLYLVLYSSFRFLVEFVRWQERANPFSGPLTSAQWLSLALLAVGIWLLSRQRSRRQRGSSSVTR